MVRKVLAVVAALIGGYLLWTGFKFARVLLILEDSRFDGTMLAIAGVIAAAGLVFMALGWWLFRSPPQPAAPPTAPPPPPAV